jgi:hypothetical protein
MTGTATMPPRAELLRRHAPWIIVLLAVAASATGLGNGFAFDDVQIIAENERLHDLSNAWRIFIQSYWPPQGGSSLYRPFTSLGFAIQWAIGGGSPLPFHVVSVAIYAAVSVAVFRFASTFLRWDAAWLTAALFAVHPVHVEAVANVVGQAELWSALLSLIAMTRFVRARKAGDLGRSDVAAIAALYFCALMFKEHVIVLPGLIVAAELTIAGKGKFGERARDLSPLLVYSALVAAVFVVVRTSVLGDIKGAGFSPLFGDAGFGIRLLTMLNVVMEWIRLFFWPANLAADYSPGRIGIATGFEASMIPGSMVIVGLIMIAVQVRRTIPAFTFAMAWTAITLAIPSNLILVTGFVLAERTLFLPSVGVLIGAAVVVDKLVRPALDRNPGSARLAAALLAIVLVLGIARSSTRNVVWKDNPTLFAQTVEDSPTSSRAHMMMAVHHSERGEMREALEETAMAVRLGSSTDPSLLAFAADMLQTANQCQQANPLYLRSLTLLPDQPQVRLNAAICLARAGDLESARRIARGGPENLSPDPRLIRIAQWSDSLLSTSDASSPAPDGNGPK